MKLALCRAYLLVTRLFFSLGQRKRYWPGTLVWHKKQKYVVKNASYHEHLLLRSVRRPVRDSRRLVSTYEVRKVRSFSNKVHDALYWWGWYKRNWLDFDAKAMSKGRRLPSSKILGKSRVVGKKVSSRH